MQPVQKDHGYAVSWTLMHLDWFHCAALPPLLVMLLQHDRLTTVWWLLHLGQQHWGQLQAPRGPVWDWHGEQQQKQNQALA